MTTAVGFQGIGWLTWFMTHRQQMLQLAEIVNAWRELPERFDTFEGLERRVTLALEAARIGVAFTPGELDDQLVEYADRVLRSQAVLELLVKLVRRASAQTAGSSLDEQLGPRDVPEFEALGIPWADLLRLVPYILEIIRELTKRTSIAD